MYSLNGINLSDYGIVVKEFRGYLDMPKRMGDTEQSWPDENGIEAFTDTDDIKFDGRDLTLIGYFESSRIAGMISTSQVFYTDVVAFTDLVELVTPYGTYDVYLKNGVDAKYLGGSFSDLKIVFREPVSSFTGLTGTGSGVTGYGIDTFDFKADYSIQITEVEGKYNLPKMKGFNPVQYAEESYSVTKFDTKEIIVRGYCEDLTKIPNLYSLLSDSGERVLHLKFDKSRNCYVKNGCSFKWIRFGKGEIEMKFRLIDHIVEVDYLADESGNLILTDSGFKIIVN